MRDHLDLLLRLAFFLVAPLVLVVLLVEASVWGAVINTALVLIIFYAGDAVRELSDTRWWVRLLTRRHLEIERYYRENPPRPFLYYIFFPLLFPYWLIKRSALREFMLFRGYNLIALVVIVASAVIQYLTVWKPIPLGFFIGAKIGGLILEVLLVLLVLMPVATTFITYSMQGKRRRLQLLSLVALASTALSIAVMIQKEPTANRQARSRVYQRSIGDPSAANAALDAALTRAAEALAKGADRQEAQAAARAELGSFYRGKEVLAFELHIAGTPPVLLLIAPATDRYPKVWRMLGKNLAGGKNVPPELMELVE